MVNINKLKGKIVENGFTVEELADKTGIPRSRFSRRFSDGGKWFWNRSKYLLILQMST